MNAQIQQLAQQNGWAFADLTGVYPPPVSARAPYTAAEQLTCVYPYGAFVSLDGVFPSAQGQAAIASTVASAIDAKYGFTITDRNAVTDRHHCGKAVPVAPERTPIATERYARKDSSSYST